MASLTPRLDKLDRNYIINGNFDYWQRGTSFLSAGAIYTADRMFCSYTTGTTNYTRSTDVPDSNSTYSLEIATTSGTNPQVNQRIESVFAKDLANKTITVKFKVKAVDATGTPIKVTVFIPTVADNFASGTSFISTVTAVATPVSNTWYTCSATFAIPASSINGLEVKIFRDSGASPVTTTTRFSQMQVVIGDNNDPNFSYAARNIIEELILCQRYYFQFVSNTLAGRASSTVITTVDILTPAELRATPSITNFGMGQMKKWDATNVVVGSASIFSVQKTYVNCITINIGGLAGLVNDNIYWHQFSCNMDAEI